MMMPLDEYSTKLDNKQNRVCIITVNCCCGWAWLYSIVQKLNTK